MALALEMDNEARNSFDGARELAKFLFVRLDVDRARSTGENEHVFRGLYSYGRKRLAPRFTDRPSEYARPRLVDLILARCSDAASQTAGGRTRSALIPSPVHVAIEALTIPEEVQSKAYAVLAFRLLLSRRFNVWPAVSFGMSAPANGELLSEARIVEEVRTIKTFLGHRDNRSAFRDNVKQFIAHFIASKGICHLRLPLNSVQKFLRGKPFAASTPAARRVVPEFRLSTRYKELPEAATLTNDILGVPIPLRGAETVFFGGLKPSADHNLVMEVAGGPGTGKTSLCLALAAAYASIDTHTLYLAFEENEEDLRLKLRAQSQPGLRRLSFRHRDRDVRWFHAERLPDLTADQLETRLRKLEHELRSIRDARRAALEARRIVPPLPLMVVLDSIASMRLKQDAGHSYAQGSSARLGPAEIRQQLLRFIDTCRKLGALVVLVSPAESEISNTLDYLVDTAIHLRVENSDKHDKKPLRLFTLSKSRHQMGRHGTHVFHLSGEGGFRIAPQLPSQIDEQRTLQYILWDRRTSVRSFNVIREGKRFAYKQLLDLPVKSKILLHGVGSTGKAGLALKIALAPRFIDGVFDPVAPRPLVISFLYPDTYYEDKRRQLLRKMRIESSVLARFGFGAREARTFVRESPGLGFIQFAPGFLSGEDLYSHLSRALEAADLEGQAYTEVVIDGLHNLALQFPGARDVEELWPIVYGTLSRANVTTISTFTTLKLQESGRFSASDAAEESLFRLRTHLPLMHTLVQASDYVVDMARDSAGSHYVTTFRSAISQEPPREEFLWDRESMDFVDARVPHAADTTSDQYR